MARRKRRPAHEHDQDAAQQRRTHDTPAQTPTTDTSAQNAKQGPQATAGSDKQTTPVPGPTPTDTDVQDAAQDTTGDTSTPTGEADTPVPIYAPLISKRPTTEADDQEQSHGPIWSASEAAKQCGVGRTTIVRRLQAGTIPGATKDEEGHWQIPLSGLLAAGLNPVRPAPAKTDDADQDADVAAAVELAELRGQLEVERARREAAEQLAAERAARIEDLRHALKMIEPPTPSETPSSQFIQSDHPVQKPQPAPQPEGMADKLRRWWRRQ